MYIESPCEADVLLLVDSSNSITNESFNGPLKTALKDIVNAIPATSKIGIIRFADIAVLEQGLTNNKAMLISAINNMQYSGFYTNTHAAFEMAQNQVFPASTGSKYVILITDGFATNESRALTAANDLKASGVIVYGVAVGQLASL